MLAFRHDGLVLPHQQEWLWFDWGLTAVVTTLFCITGAAYGQVHSAVLLLHARIMFCFAACFLVL